MDVEITGKILKIFGTVLTIWQKNTCGRAEFLKTIQAVIIYLKVSPHSKSPLMKFIYSS